MAVRPGDVIAGKYRVERVLGIGGMGVVVAAEHLGLQEQVALKFLLPEMFTNREASTRFLREARAAVRLKSEHVARVLDTGALVDGSPFIVMEFLEGHDLAVEVRQRGRLPATEIAEYIVHASDALAEAHVGGLVHRDLKPGNLFLTRRPDGSPLVKVLDFGISKASWLNDQGFALTQSSAIVGSPLYMSPEQMRSATDADARSDVWSLGVTMYELASGTMPFQSDTLAGLLVAVTAQRYVPLRTLRPEVPQALCDLIARCLQVDPEKRCPSMAEVARGLASLCPPRALPIVDRIESVTRGGRKAPPPVNDATPPSFGSAPTLHEVGKTAGATTDGQWGGTHPEPSRTGPRRAALGVVALGILGVGAAGLATRGAPSAAPRSPAKELDAPVTFAPVHVAPATSAPVHATPALPASADAPLPAASALPVASAAPARPSPALPSRSGARPRGSARAPSSADPAPPPGDVPPAGLLDDSN